LVGWRDTSHGDARLLKGNRMRRALVFGAGGFIGSHMVKRLKKEGYWVRGVDLKYPEFSRTEADEFVIADLRVFANVWNNISVVSEPFDEVYQFAADMGGAGYIFTGEHDSDIMHNSAQINLNTLDCLLKMRQVRGANDTVVFYSSSACIYPEYNQLDPDNPNCSEQSAYPADPDSEYGWEKLFSERLYLAYHRNHGIPVRIARFHNIFGPEGTWEGGKEKAPAAICRKVAEVEDGGTIEVWGDGEQTRSFLYIDECIEAVRRLVASDFTGPVNIGSEEMVSINELVHTVAVSAAKTVNIKHIDGPLGVRGRNSDNDLIRKKLGWDYEMSLAEGIDLTYDWIKEQIDKQSA
jgi:GDP-D-mannose 3', 5'-epimerase